MSKKNSFLSRLKESLFPPERDIHLSVFILLAIGGIIVSVVVAFYNLAMGFGIWNFLAIIVAGVSYSVAMIIYTHRTGQYRGPMIITVFVVFIGLFSYLFSFFAFTRASLSFFLAPSKKASNPRLDSFSF